jgi:S1-C subfamily serine protease
MIHAWEKYGLEAAQAKFESEYKAGTRSFTNVVYGKLAYLKHVKGREDLVYRRLYNRAVIQEGKYDKVLPVTEIEDLYQRIFVVKSGGQYGTGFILDEKWLITCAHVLDSDEVKFFNYDKARLPQSYHASSQVKEWISPSKEFDMAALPIDASIANEANTLRALPAPSIVETGDECRILGFPQYYIGAVPQVIDVKVVSVESNKYGIYDAHVDRTLVAGNSGGPVLNSRNQVIGIVRTGAPDRDDVNGLGSTFLPIQEMRKCLASFEKAKSPVAV